MTGTIYLRNSMGQGQHYPVRDSQGGPEYYLGDAARNHQSGWVRVTERLVHTIEWNTTDPAPMFSHGSVGEWFPPAGS